ncbi:39S ribosomal protein L39, mitochondrial [Armadillidium vulgare]|nr:39S ribosomal protein L39, mitochondrial [Armadillidium vulgare]
MFITGKIIRLCSNPKVTQLSSRHRRKFLEIKSFSCFNSDSNFGLHRKYHRSITNEEVKHKRIELYDKEVKRQNALITDIEKIEVRYEDLHKLIMDRSALAEVDGDIWDLFRPLTHNCTLRFLHFKEIHFTLIKPSGRSMSLMLGAVLENSFNIDYYVQLCSFPPPKVLKIDFTLGHIPKPPPPPPSLAL